MFVNLLLRRFWVLLKIAPYAKAFRDAQRRRLRPFGARFCLWTSRVPPVFGSAGRHGGLRRAFRAPPPGGQVSLWWPDQGNSVCSRRPPRQDGGTSGASRLQGDEFAYGGLPALTEASGSAAAAARYARIPGLAYPDASYLFSSRLPRGFARTPMYFPQVRTATMPGRGRLGSWFRRHVS